MKKKVMRKVFRTYFFKISRVDKDVVTKLLDQIISDKKVGSIRSTYGKKVSLVSLSKDSRNGVYFGDLQQVHTDDLPNKIKFDNEDRLLQQEGFAMDEGLGYNNCFAYLPNSNVIVLENNINGVGYKALSDFMNSLKEECKIESKDLLLGVMTSDNKSFDDTTNFEEVEFNISNFQKIDETPFSEFNKLMDSWNVQSCKIIIKNKKNFLNSDSVRSIIPFLSKNKKTLKITTLKAKLEGENTELNFLHNKIFFKSQIEIEDQNSVPFSLRKEEMTKAIQYLKDKDNYEQ